jgi:hypothetical protein
MLKLIPHVTEIASGPLLLKSRQKYLLAFVRGHVTLLSKAKLKCAEKWSISTYVCKLLVFFGSRSLF